MLESTSGGERGELQRIANGLPKSGTLDGKHWELDFGHMVRRVLYELDMAEEAARHHEERARVR